MNRVLTSRRDFLLQGAALASVTVAAHAETANRVPVIDCHAHVGHAPALTDPWTAIGDPEEILTRNREARIDQSVTFPISNDTYEAANKEIAAVCKRYHGHFIGYAKHDPVTEKGRIRAMLMYEYHELGLRGLKLHVQPGPEVLDTVAELGIPIIYHPGRVAMIEGISRDYPSVDFIVAHCGSDLSADWREHLAAIELAGQRSNVYLDTGGFVETRYIERAIHQLGAEKVIFGSDEPEVDCRLEIFKIRMLKLPEAQEQLVLGGNLQRLLAKSGERTR
jgi:predicted TIM-barrel fold metal-dependent hydrolase